jgi:membrane protease YdiL (CAAX protease family)
MMMGNQVVNNRKSLWIYFVIAFLIPIVTTILVTLIAGFPSGLVTNQIDINAIIVLMAMVHAPTIAAMIAAYIKEGSEGIKNLFRQLKYWRFKAKWYLRALLIFPLSILASLLLLSLFSESFTPDLFISILAFGTLFSALWEEIGWTGFATPHLLQRFRPLKTALLLGIIHTFWHLVADYWGASAYYGELYRYAIHFLLWMVGLTVLRILIIWIYVRTDSLVLGWLTHFSYTGGQLLLVPLALTAVETLLWNAVFVTVLLLVMGFLIILNKDFREFWKIGSNQGQNLDRL